MHIQEVLDEIVSRIVKRFHPERIILFGSHARGTAQTDSDVDLLIVMPVPDTRRKLATEIDLSLVGIDIPTDVIVVTFRGGSTQQRSNRNDHPTGDARG